MSFPWQHGKHESTERKKKHREPKNTWHKAAIIHRRTTECSKCGVFYNSSSVIRAKLWLRYMAPRVENNQSLYWCKDVRISLFPRRAVVETRWFVNPTQTLYHVNDREGRFFSHAVICVSYKESWEGCIRFLFQHNPDLHVHTLDSCPAQWWLRLSRLRKKSF